MNMISRVGKVGVLALCGFALQAQTEEIRNWQAPLYWAPGESKTELAERGAAISGPLALVAVSPCRVMDTRPEYAYLGFAGVFGAPAFQRGQQREVPIAQSLCALATGQSEEANQLAMSGWVEGNQDEIRFIMALALYEKGETRTAQAMFLDVSQRANPTVRAAVQTWLDKTGLTLP